MGVEDQHRGGVAPQGKYHRFRQQLCQIRLPGNGMMELRPDPDQHDLRHLCVVKGNYLSDEYKHDSFVLRFSPGLNFEATGERVPFCALRERTDDEQEEKVALARAMRNEGKSYQQIADELGYKSRSAVQYLLNK